FFCATMVISLTPSFTDSSSLNKRGIVAKVGDQEIAAAEIAQAAREMGRQQFGGSVPDQLLPMIMPRVAQDLITRKAVEFEAGRLGLKVTEDGLRRALRQQLGQLFFPGATFVGDQQYEEIIQRNGLPVHGFESDFRS